MGELAKKNSVPNKDSIQKLLAEISVLEENISIIGGEISTFENTLRQKLGLLISRLVSLNEKMKEKQQLKKAKRLEQKKRGKNYKEPVQVLSPKPTKKFTPESSEDEKQELRRLYKEAIVQVHPDKLGPSDEEDAVKTATDLTAQLNNIYKNGDLEQLLNFYQINIQGYSGETSNLAETVTVNPKIRLEALKTKKESLARKLKSLEANYLYHVLKTYDNPLTFINELELQFQEKIGKLEKRTRKI
ncbi:hypothetical protein [Cognataquiflexum rubidum]|uniref:hypothetical protein n=1 Tax=Cognataquiflexum rubidum TaxID=2922273 RepID=UPI001F12E231|nr:hypothetical protein [Cognataquiflexum rubidum]MCH6232360.1 hypothetical protein [Cognataquiflexum rubidum]